jgi:hypothetical protein
MRTIIKAQASRASPSALQSDTALLYDDNVDVPQALDCLCLGLGLLTNLVQVTDEAKESSKTTCKNVPSMVLSPLNLSVIRL